VTNASADLSADSTAVTLNLPAGVQLVEGQQTQQLGSLAANGTGSGDHAAASWVVRATANGSHLLTATTDAQHCAEHFTAQSATAFTPATPQPSPGGGNNGGGGIAAGGGGQSPPTPKTTPHLRISAKRWRGTRLQVTGSLAAGAAGHVAVTYTAVHHGNHVRVTTTTSVRHGRFSVLLKLPTRMRGVHATLTISYRGDPHHKPQTTHTHLR
jgi:hypothetical protein